MATLPAIRTNTSQGRGIGAPPNSDTSGGVERPVEDERLGNSGFHPRGSFLQQQQQRMGGGAGPRPGAAYSGAGRLVDVMGSIDSQLRGLLEERVQLNSQVLRSIKEATSAVLPAEPVRYGSPKSSGGAGMQGALFLAAAPGSPQQGGTIGEAASTSVGSPMSLAPRPKSASRIGDHSTRIGGPAWGTNEGGIDRLGWVRSLVRYTESHPIYVPDDRSPEVAMEANGAVKKTVFPNVQPNRREDVILLQKWLEDMSRHLAAHRIPALQPFAASNEASQQQQQQQYQEAAAAAPSVSESGSASQLWQGLGGAAAGAGRPPEGPGTALELADGMLHVYNVAFEELKRQVSLECRERGDLLSALLDHMWSLVEMRTALEGESRVAAMHAEYMRVMEARDKLSQDIHSLEQSLADADKDQRSAASSAAQQTRSLALKLVQAQAQAEELQRSWRVSDLALQNEVEKRLAAAEELTNTKELLNRTEHEWLHFRSAVTALEEQNRALTAQLDAARKELQEAAVAREAAHREYEALVNNKAEQEVELVRMRHEYETDEILVVSLKQQVRDLEAQLAQLKSFQRDQALKLGGVVAEKEVLEAQNAQLQVDLKEANERGDELQKQLDVTDQELADTKRALRAKCDEYDQTKARLEAELTTANKQTKELEQDVRQLTNALMDAQHNLSQCEKTLRETNLELDTLREMLSSVARMMESQGVESMPKNGDEAWAVPGPLGAGQRVIAASSRHITSLWERLEATRNENAVLAERLQAEMDMQRRLHDALHESRTQEARIMRDKEEVEMQLDISNQAKRVMEVETGQLKSALAEAETRVSDLEGRVRQLTQRVELLSPLEGVCKELSTQVEHLNGKLTMTEEALKAAKEDIVQLNKQLDYYKEETDRMLADRNDLLDEIKLLTVYRAEAEELKMVKADLDNKTEDLERQLAEALDSLARAQHQLEVAKFFLQGLDLVPPQSPVGSTASAPFRGRPGSGASAMGMVSRPDSAVMEDLLRPDSAGPSWRPGTAPPNLARTVHGPSRPTSARPPRSGVGRASNTAADGEEYINVSPLQLPLVAEEDEEEQPRKKQEEYASLPPGLLHMSPMMQQAVARGEVVPMGAPTAGAAAGVGPTLRRPGSSRPLSAMSATSTGSSVYGPDVPPEVAALLDAQGAAEVMATSNARWLKFKIKVLAGFCARLRSQLQQETEKRAELEVQLAQFEVDSLKASIQREEYIVNDLLGNLRGQLERARHDTLSELSASRSELPSLRYDLLQLASRSAAIGLDLREWQARMDARGHVGTQTGEGLDAHWAAFIQGLPSHDPMQPLGSGALGDAIVRIYLRQLPTVSLAPVWGEMRTDTVYDAIMEHYNSQRAPGKYSKDFLKDPESPVGRLLRSTRASTHITRVAMFAYLTGMAPDGVVWPMSAWHFLLHLLHCLKVLLAGTWKSTVRAWAAPSGTTIPIQAVYDLVGNLFNVQVPGDLEPSMTKRLASIVVPGQSGPVVDLDALLLLLVNEHNAGTCPRHCLLFPRRLTDGSLFNIFNSAGYSPYSDSLAHNQGGGLISTSPPGSPKRTARLGPAPLPGAAESTGPMLAVGSMAARPKSGAGVGTTTLQYATQSGWQQPMSLGVRRGLGEGGEGAQQLAPPHTPSRPGTALSPSSGGGAPGGSPAHSLSQRVPGFSQASGRPSVYAGVTASVELASDGNMRYLRPAALPAATPAAPLGGTNKRA